MRPINPNVAKFADFVALAYHEARNVRHLVKAGYLDRSRYRMLIDTLDNEKRNAWKKLESLRQTASAAKSAQEAENVFARRFGLTLEDLAYLSGHVRWSGTERGGNRWVEIDRALIRLRTSIDEGDQVVAAEQLKKLDLMCHNTGLLGEKLQLLDGRDRLEVAESRRT